MSDLVPLPRAQQRVVPWRNGGGRTREVALAPDGDAFRWRVSVARIAADGPFSRFPGIDRQLWLLSGAGMDLTIDGRLTRLDRPLAAVAFPGEADVSARLLGGPTEDLNVMVARGRVRSTCQVLLLAGPTPLQHVAAAAGTDLVLALDAPLRAACAAGAVDLAPGDALRLDRGAAGRTWTLASAGPAAVLVATFA